MTFVAGTSISHSSDLPCFLPRAPDGRRSGPSDQPRPNVGNHAQVAKWRSRPQADVDRSPNRTSNRGKADIQEFLPRRCMSLICVIACDFLNAFIPSSAHLGSVIPRLREVSHDVPTIRCCANRSDVSSAYVRSLLRHSPSPDATDRARRPCSDSRGSPAARTAGAGRLGFLTECRSRCSSYCRAK